jgi:serine/threonine protein kinase
LLLKDRYRGIKPIGQGGFGRTFLAVDEDKPSKPRCVIKQFFPQAQGTSNIQKAAELFHQEAMRLDELGKHPQIPDLLAHFEQDGFSYLVQEFIPGSTLSQELASKRSFNETEVRLVLNDLLPVLQFVHSQQVIHRDIKPANIIRRSPPLEKGGQGGIVLVDFGASKVATPAALQQTGTTIGSPEYVAPEQARGWAVFASDIYSLGVTCIHLLTGLSPFNLYDMQQDRWVWRQFLQRPVSDVLAKILDKMLESALNRRYQSAVEVLRDLNSQTPAPVPAKPPSPPVKLSPVVAPNPVAKGIIDQELADVSSQCLGVTPGKKHQEAANSQKPLSSPNTQSKSQIDRELEELRSQFIDPGN